MPGQLYEIGTIARIVDVKKNEDGIMVVLMEGINRFKVSVWDLEGDYLINAQGEDVVAGIRTPKPVQELEGEMPKLYSQLVDLRDRLVALHCWMVTRRNVAAWIADVDGYIAATAQRERAACRRRLRQMVQSELASTRQLLELWESSSTEFMAFPRIMPPRGMR